LQSIKPKLLLIARNIANATASLVAVQEDQQLKKILEASRRCVQDARVLMDSTNKPYEVNIICEKS
jgi:hypothetical protein